MKKVFYFLKFALFLLFMGLGSGVSSNSDVPSIPPSTKEIPQAKAISQSVEQKKPTFKKAQPLPNTTTAEQRLSNPGKRLWNLQDADIQAVIAAMSKETGRNFIISPGVTGKVTVVSSQPIDADEAYQVFLSALNLLGYSAIEEGEMTKIVANTVAKQSAPVELPTDTPSKDQGMIVQVVHVKNISAAQIAPILQPLIPNYGQITAYAPANTLILAGSIRDIERVKKIVKDLDQTSANDIDLIRIYHASADKMVALIKSLQQADRALGKAIQVSLVADDQQNSILMTGTLEARLKMRVLISELDVANKNGSTTRTFALNHLKAKDFAPVLTKVAESTYANTFASTSAAKTKQKVTVQAEEKTNTIIVSAPTSLFPMIESVVKKLDVETRQVLVEASIVEVNENMSKVLGTLWQADATNANPAADGFNVFNLNFKPITSGIIPNLQFRAFFRALFTTGVSDILSRPSTVVLDNQPATIGVGSTVSIDNQEYNQDQSGSGNFFTTKERVSVELRLTVTPQISPNNSIQLEVEIKNDTISPDFTQESQPINTSNIKTSVRVDSGDVVVLGGLMRHDFRDATQKLPILGDIPAVKPAFARREKVVEKKELLVFIRPIVLDHQNNQRILEERYDHIREAELAHYYEQSIIRAQNETPLLPLYKDTKRIPKPFEE